MTRSVNQLKCLHDEFDLANATPSKFHIARQLFRSNNVALDAVLNTCNLSQQTGCGALRVNERLMLPQEFVCQLATARDAARLNQRKPFPGLTEPRVIIFHALERARQRAR